MLGLWRRKVQRREPVHLRLGDCSSGHLYKAPGSLVRDCPSFIALPRCCATVDGSISYCSCLGMHRFSARFLLLLMAIVTFTGGGRHLVAAADHHAPPAQPAYFVASVLNACAPHDCRSDHDHHSGCPHTHANCCGSLALPVSGGPVPLGICDRSEPFDLGSTVPHRQRFYLPQRPPSATA